MMNFMLKEKKMSTELMIKDLENTQQMCSMLMKTPHYRKIGDEGIFAIVERSKVVGVNPMSALNGGMYYVRGKVELSAAMMNELIRSKGHSITKDKASNEKICILHGKRKDNGDTWCESFSIDDAQKAGIYANQWLKYPKDMLFARALSRLARQLFPDVIKGCYVEGEIQPEVLAPLEEKTQAPEGLTDEQVFELEELLKYNPEKEKKFLNFMELKGFNHAREIPLATYTKMLKSLKEEQEQLASGDQ